MERDPKLDTPYGFESDDYLRRRIHQILQEQIDMGMYGKLFRGGTVLGGGAECTGGTVLGGTVLGGREDNLKRESRDLERQILKDRSAKELRKDAKDLGIKGYSTMDKKALIRALMKKPVHDGEITSGYHPFIEKKSLAKAMGPKMAGGAATRAELVAVLHKLTVKELKKLAKKMKIRGYSNKRKSELVLLLEKYA